MLKTSEGKEAAVAALVERRAVNKDRKRIDNSSLPAGSPMYFSCLSCNGVITVPEGYYSRPKLCEECAALKEMGWLE